MRAGGKRLLYAKTKKLVVQAQGLGALWAKFHEQDVSGGHSGLRATALKIQELYHFDGNLEAWISKKLQLCRICAKRAPPLEVNPSNTLE